MSGITNVPTSIKDPQLRMFLQQVATAIRTGSLGIGQAATTTSLGNAITSALGTVADTSPFANLSVPGGAAGLTGAGGFTSIILNWDILPYPNNISHTEIWRCDHDTQGDAVLVGTSSSYAYIDSVGVNETWFYWIRYVSYAGVPGLFNALAGLSVSTGVDVSALLGIMTGQITSSQLRADLLAPIAMVPGLADDVSDVQIVQGVLSSQYMVKVVAGQYVSGFGLAADATGSSTFLVSATRFAVGDPAYPDKVPFIVATVNGVTTIALNATTLIPDASITGGRIAGTTITDANIALGTITGAKIDGGTITGANIQGGAITNTHITDGSISGAKITGGTITGAKIETGGVGTINIEGNAVTVPAATSADANLVLTASMQTVGSGVTVNWGANPPGSVIVLATMNSTAGAGSGASSLAMRVNSTVGGTAGDIGITVAGSVSATTAWRYVSQTGTCTYTIQASNSAGGQTHTAHGWTLIVLGVKR